MDKGLVKLLEEQIVESESGAYDVGEQRERNHRYYTMQPLGNEQRGRSHYIDPSVMEAVEGKKALFQETFLSNRQAVKFKSGGSQNPMEADAKTAYVNRVLRKNHYEELFRDGWHDAFVAKRMSMLVMWKEETKSTTIDITGAQREQVEALIAQQGNVVSVDDSGIQAQTMPGMQGPTQVFMGELQLEVDDSYPEIILMEPERFYRDPLADYVRDSMWCTYEEDVPRGTLINKGYDEELIDSLSVDYRFRSDEEDAARKAHDMSWTRRKQYDRTNGQEHVTFYRSWTWLNLADDEFTELNLQEEPADEIRLYEIHWAHGEIMTKEGVHCVYEAEEMPFFEWTEMTIAHAEHGLCTADVTAHIQKTQSTLKRLIIDNQQMRNNTRYEAVIGALKNPRDLLDNKIGGTVWSRAIGSVAPLATPELSPLTMGVVQMLQMDLERRDGFSALGKGMNEDAVRYQNADSMVERLTNAGTKRPMGAARDWALNFLIPLSQYIVTLAMRNDQSQDQLEVRGRMIPIVPAQWEDDELDMEAAVALTPQEGKEHGQALLTMHGLMSQDPDLMQVYGLQQKHALMDAVFDALGVADTTPYMQRPDSPEFQQMQQQQQQMAEQEKKKQEALIMLDGKLRQSEDKRKWEEFRWNQTIDMQSNTRDDRKTNHDMNIDKQQQRLDWFKFNWDMRVDSAEVKIEREQKRAALVGDS